MAQLVECMTLDFGSGHGLKVMRSSPTSGTALVARGLLKILSVHALSLPLSACALSLSLKNKINIKKI